MRLSGKGDEYADSFYAVAPDRTIVPCTELTRCFGFSKLLSVVRVQISLDNSSLPDKANCMLASQLKENATHSSKSF